MLMPVNVSGPRFRYCESLMQPFKLEIEKLSTSNETLALYKATGKLSLETVNEFIQRVRPEPAQHLILDLSGVSFLDSAGVGSLVSLFVNRRNSTKTFALRRCHSKARRLWRWRVCRNCCRSTVPWKKLWRGSRRFVVRDQELPGLA